MVRAAAHRHAYNVTTQTGRETFFTLPQDALPPRQKEGLLIVCTETVRTSLGTFEAENTHKQKHSGSRVGDAMAHEQRPQQVRVCRRQFWLCLTLGVAGVPQRVPTYTVLSYK